MEHLMEILFICTALPMIPVISILPDSRSKLFVGYMAAGALICCFAAYVNTYLLGFFGGDVVYVTTAVTPVSEEIMKAIPVLLLAAFFTDDRDTLLSVSFAEGIGFAVLENSVILVQNLNAVSVTWALARVIGAVLMHGACTAAVGMGMSCIRKRKKLFFCGTFSLLISAVIFHASFNVLIQSRYSSAAFVLPAALYLPIMAAAVRRQYKKNGS